MAIVAPSVHYRALKIFHNVEPIETKPWCCTSIDSRKLMPKRRIMIENSISPKKIETIEIMKAKIADSEDIWLWRNDDLTKKMSITSNDIRWEEHCVWYRNCLIDPNIYFYVGYIDLNKKIGTCRFNVNIDSSFAEVSINMNPKFRGKNLSSKFLSSSIEIFHSDKNVNLIARIKKINLISIKCFINNGFTLNRNDEDCNYYFYPRK